MPTAGEDNSSIRQLQMPAAGEDNSSIRQLQMPTAAYDNFNDLSVKGTMYIHQKIRKITPIVIA
jgi:hypothetical protein